ncbi:MAG: HD domain-containing protein [Vicinamibacterales bacterium]
MPVSDIQAGRDPRSRLRTAQQAFAADAASGNGGREAAARFSASLDQIVREVLTGFPGPSQPMAVVALGGYGRRELCLHSDIDLMFLFERGLDHADERFLQQVLQPLWDLDLVLGHHVRSLDDFETPDLDNPEFLLALMDARPLFGDTTLLDRISSRFHDPETDRQLVDALLTLVDDRHASFNDTPYQLEPDVKDAPGGLRDVLVTRLLVRLTPSAHVHRSPGNEGRLEAAKDFLLRVRSLLHVRNRRNTNLLDHEAQEWVAPAVGYPARSPRHGVELLMGDYFRHARSVYRACEWARKRARPPAPFAPVAITRNLERAEDGIRFVDRARAVAHPASWLGVFQAALDAGCGVDDETLNDISQHVDRFEPDDFCPSAAHRERLMAFLRPRPGLYARLSDMHDCGLLGGLFPEFRRIGARVTRDFFHRYTVDEHTLLAIREVESLVSTGPKTPAQERVAALLQEVESPELLVLALLFHDVGKWVEENHALESERLAARALTRLQLPRPSCELVEFLIRHHLEMSKVAFRRDTEDPEVVERFARLVGVEERLKMLCLLTFADVGAVGPGTRTPWKEELLWRLYVDTYNEITLAYSDRLIEHEGADLAGLLNDRPADVTDSEITEFVEGLPRRYLQTFAAPAIYAHVRLSRDIHRDTVHVTLEQKDVTWELTVVTVDRPALFATVCGALSTFGMDILRGQAMTNPHGLVLDVFQFTDSERFLALNPDSRGEFLDVIEGAVTGRVDVNERLRGRLASPLNRRPKRVVPIVRADTAASRRYTVLEIVANDELGLLYRIGHAISTHGCDIELVLISTEGHKAVDVFHISKGGTKLTEDQRQRLTADLQERLENPT